MRRAVIFLSTAVLAAGVTCSRAPRTIGSEVSQVGNDFSAAATGTAVVINTQAALEEQWTQATQQSQMTAEAVPTTAATREPGASIEVDFSTESGVFAYSADTGLEGGTLLFGPAESCAMDMPDYSRPAGCIAICRECISRTGEFRMTTDWQYADGVSEREIGIILRFVDENDDGLLGDEDYFLALGMSIFSNDMNVYIHTPGTGLPLQLVETVDGGFNSPPAMNSLEIISSDSGREIDILVDGGHAFRLRGYSSEPGETFVESWEDSGAVGLVLLARGVQARYDNFTFQETDG